MSASGGTEIQPKVQYRRKTHYYQRSLAGGQIELRKSTYLIAEKALMHRRTNPRAAVARLTRAAALLSFSVFLTPAFSQQEPPRHRLGKFWKISLVALATATTADAVSSWNRPESNPILRNSDGQFNARGAGIKIGLAGSVALAQYFLARKGPKAERVSAFANLAAAGVFTGAAIRNWSHAPAATPGGTPAGAIAVQ